MSDNSILLNNLVMETVPHQDLRNEVQQEQAETNALTIPDVVISLTPITLIFSWIAFFIILRKSRTSVNNKMSFSIKSLHKVPCKNCQYYTNNNYIKCAVQPSIVLTEEAKNCSDYSPHQGKLSPKNIFGKDNNSD